MNHYEPNDYDDFDPVPEGPNRGRGGGFDWEQPGGGSWFETLRQLWHWNDLAAEIGQESQARVAFVGLAGAGKSFLFNRLRGWTISGEPPNYLLDAYELHEGLQVELLGVFVLADLPEQPPALWATQELLPTLGDPALVVYLLDGEKGVSAADYRWVAALRAAGRPVLTVLNKCDLLANPAEAVTEAAAKLGMPVVPISALTGWQVNDGLLPAMLDRVPRLAVPLGRELSALRQHAARRVIRQAALLSGVAGVQPVPLLDLPFQVMIQVGVVMRVGAAYGYVPTGSMSREVVGTVISTLGVRYGALALVKMIPFVGWAVAGLLSGGMTVVFGEAAIRYYESGASIPLAEQVHMSRSWWPRRQLPEGKQPTRPPVWRRLSRSRPKAAEAAEEMIEVIEINEAETPQQEE